MNTLEEKSGIYSFLCLANSKRYIGQSKNLKKRQQTHMSELKNNRHFNSYLQKAYNKYGKEQFQWEVLEYCNIGNLNEREIYWINYYNSFKEGFNMTEGGAENRIYFRTEELKENLSKTLKEKWANSPQRKLEQSERMKGVNNPMYGRTGSTNPAFGKDHSGIFNGMYGKHQTEEAKEKNRQKHLGANNKNSKPIICVETEEYFSSQGEAGRAKGIDSSGINKVLKGSKKTAAGYHWRYATEEEQQQHLNA